MALIPSPSENKFPYTIFLLSTSLKFLMGTIKGVWHGCNVMLFASTATGRATAEIVFSLRFFPELCAPCLFRELWWDRVAAWKETKVVSIPPSYCFEFALIRFLITIWTLRHVCTSNTMATDDSVFLPKGKSAISKHFDNWQRLRVNSLDKRWTICHFPYDLSFSIPFPRLKRMAQQWTVFFVSKPPGG